MSNTTKNTAVRRVRPNQEKRDEGGGGDVYDWVAKGVASSLLPAPSSLT